MATVTLTIQSLLNTAVYGSYTLDNSTTIANVKAAIQSNTSVDSTWYQLVYNNDLMSNTSATLADYGIVANTTLRSANKIGQLSSLEDRQQAKLLLAELDRQASSNPRDTYDISQLPSYFSGNTTVDNPNAGGLIEGRPWAKLDPGLYLQPYSGYFADDVNWFATATTTGTASTPSVLEDLSVPLTTSYQWLGYFRAPVTGTYTFYTYSDDASYVWVGANASTNFTTVNAVASQPGEHPGTEGSGTIALVEGHLYSFRIQNGNNAAGGEIRVSFAVTGIAKTKDFTNYVFYNPDTNGL